MALADALTTKSEGAAVLLQYAPHDSENRLSDVKQLLATKNVQTADADIVVYDRFDPGDFEERLEGRLRTRAVRRVLVDISTMSKLGIILVLNVCRNLGIAVRIFYAEAEEYGPSKEEFDHAVKDNAVHRPTLQVFTGVHGVVRVRSLASVSMQGEPTAAIVFMSFNDVLTQVLLNTVSPARLFLVNGRPPIHAWREAATAWIHDQVRKEWSDDNPLESSQLPARTVSTLDYRETVALLLDLYWSLSSRYRVLIAPAGSKMQAVGCFVVKSLHPDVHIEYPSPKGFFPSYSRGVGPMWFVDLGRLPDHIAALAIAERSQYLQIPM